MNYDDMSTEELEKAFFEAKEQESNLEKGDQSNEEMLRQEKLPEQRLRGQEEEISSTSNTTEGETPQPDDTIEYETSDNNTQITEQPVASNEDSTPESVATTPDTLYKTKANGKEFEMTLDELKQTASKGMDYLKKTTALKPYRTMIAAMEENKVSPEDINLLIDLKKGNKEAIAKLIKENEVDVYDLPEANDYKPQEYRQSETALDMKEVLNTISKDTEFSRTSEIYAAFDDQTKAFLNEDPSRIAGLHNDIKTGVFDKVLPLAEKKAMIDGYNAPFLQYYLQAGQEILNANNRPIQTEQKQYVPPENRANKIAAGLPSSRADKKSVIDYLDEEISDEDYKEWYSRLQRRV